MKALALLSGGLDSTIAAKLVLSQGIEVVAVNFTSPFCLCGKGGCGSAKVAKELGMPLKIIDVGQEYLKMLRNPKHGYGRNMNPCIDCRILMLKKAKRYAGEIKASFLFTGEVLDERPMSQNWKAMNTIEQETGLKNKIVRPLSAKLLPATVAEEKGWINRQGLSDIRGRSRKRQFGLAETYGINDYPCPSGGCLLTYKEFADKVRDLFTYQKKITLKDIQMLKIGRHFRSDENKIIVGRNEDENKQLLNLKKHTDYYFEVSDCGSPITILQGPKTKVAIEKAAKLTTRYSDAQEKATVRFGRKTLTRKIIVSQMSIEELMSMRIKGKGSKTTF